ncbi:universal stress protein [Aurantimonas sp. A2-1-M11]|uniref:universal stress protein n=1 Tax=Aurantimonas sp. A2-1-M11 TaxID=3113712 RepID=UPI002F91CB15
MKKILLATDFSERSDRALRRATLLARQFSASLSIVHVVDDDQPKRIVDSERDAASALLRELRTTVQTVDAVDCETRVVLADPFAGIARAAEEEAPDILVIGRHRRKALLDVFVGTTAERTIRSVQCPVLMVNAPPVGSYHHIMLTTDLSEGSGNALQRYPRLRLSDGAQTTLLYVFDAPALRLAFNHSLAKDEREFHRSEEKKNASRLLSDFLENIKLGGVSPLVRYEASPAPYEILETTRAERADLIVLSTYGRTGIGKLLLGSVTEQVLRNAPVDVLAIPPLLNV